MTAVPSPRVTPSGSYGRVNWTGLWTLVSREVRRFLKVGAQTILGPAVITLLYLIIFDVALRRGHPPIDGVPFLEFLAPGLIIMAMAQNSFANSSSSLLIGKVQGTIGDLLMAPLSPAELTAGFTLGAVARGLLVGIVVALAMLPFVSHDLRHPAFVVFHGLAGAMLLSLIGILTGLWALKMDQQAVVTNFVIVPLTFLSGTFYSIEDLPGALRLAAQVNPFFYMIDGFRYGFIGRSDGSLALGVAVMAASNAVMVLLAYRALRSGWRIKP